jgi:hypothetical protein
VLAGVNSERSEGVEVEVKDVHGGGLHYYLELVIVLEPIGVLAVAAVGWTTGGLYIGNVPGFGSKDAKEGGRIEGAGPFLAVIGLLNNAPLFCPIPLQREYQILKCQNFIPPKVGLITNPANEQACMHGWKTYCIQWVSRIRVQFLICPVKDY